MTGVGAPVAAGVVIWAQTGNWLQGGLVTLGLVLGIGLLLFIGKFATIPPTMAAEVARKNEEEIIWLRDRLNNYEDVAKAREERRRHDVVRQLIAYHMHQSDGVSPAMAAGLELPPENWLNQELQERAENFRVAVVGHQWQVRDALPSANYG